SLRGCQTQRLAIVEVVVGAVLDRQAVIARREHRLSGRDREWRRQTSERRALALVQSLLNLSRRRTGRQVSCLRRRREQLPGDPRVDRVVAERAATQQARVIFLERRQERCDTRV